MMTIPHVNVAFGDLPDRLKMVGDEVPVPREILARLLDLYILCWGFDEDWYLSTYPDIEEAVKQNLFASGWAHFPGHVGGQGYQRIGSLYQVWIPGRALAA